MVWKTPRQHGTQSRETGKRKRPGARKQLLHAPPFLRGRPPAGSARVGSQEPGQQESGRGQMGVLSRGPGSYSPASPLPASPQPHSPGTVGGGGGKTAILRDQRVFMANRVC